MSHSLERATQKFGLSAAATYRWAIASRTLLAIFGSYVFAALAAASLGLLLPGPRAQAVLGATMLAFVLYCAMAIWAFSAASPGRAWLVGSGCMALPALHLLLTDVTP